MKTYYFKGIMQNSGWIEDASVVVDKKGRIAELSTFDRKDASIDLIDGYVIPGFQNAHSHAFQYAMAGLAEAYGGGKSQDDFWGWREAMYQLALGMDPDQMESIATMLYAEMVRHGYTNVAEFHYVHHDKNGKHYENLAEMGTRLIAAAQTAGIGITLIPIFYQKGGFGQEPNERQRRFISPTIDAYLALLEASKAACAFYDNANVGIGIHSMRGVEPTDIAIVSDTFDQTMPFHIHVSEQLKEIEDSVAYLGLRPVEWLLEHINLNGRHQLVHATHLTNEETTGIAKSKANVVLCPSTEGNLGDGIFPLRKFQAEDGKWSIGTDSHIGINPLEELRILDYGQRLISHKRNTFPGTAGMYALEMATITGRKAMNNSTTEFFKVGEPFNACVIDATSPLIATASIDNLTNTIVYASDPGMHLAAFSYGELIVSDGKHKNRKEITNQFRKTINELENR